MKILFFILSLVASQVAFGALSESDKAFLQFRNLLVNPGFESGLAGVTYSSVAPTITTAGSEIGEGNAALSWNSTSAGQTLTITGGVIPKAWYGQNGMLSCGIQTPSGTATHTIGFWDGSTLSNAQTVNSRSTYVFTTVNGVIPSSGSLHIRLTSVSADEPAIKIDRCRLQLSDNVGSSPVVGPWTAYSPAILGLGTLTNNVFQWRVNGENIEVMGSVSTGTPTATAITIPLPSGYTINFAKQTTSANWVTGQIWRLEGAASYATSGDGPWPIFSDGTTAGSLFVAVSTTSNLYNKALGNGPFGTNNAASIRFTVPVTQLNDVTTFRADVTPANWNGYTTVSGGCSTSSTTYADTSACTSIALTEQYNRNFGTVTTAGSSLPGITFTPPRTGNFLVCASGTISSTLAATASVRMTDGTNVLHNGVSLTNTTVGNGTFHLCGTESISTVASTTVKLQLATSTSTSAIVNGSASGSSAIAWSIVEMDAPMPGPVILGVRSEVWVTNPTNSSGSTLNRYFSTVQRNEGTGITYATSTTNGDTFTINNPGLYTISYTDSWTSSTSHGVSLNSASLATGIEAQPATVALCAANGGARSSSGINCSVTLRLSAGDVLRANTQGAVSGSGAATLASFHITQVSP